MKASAYKYHSASCTGPYFSRAAFPCRLALQGGQEFCQLQPQDASGSFSSDFELLKQACTTYFEIKALALQWTVARWRRSRTTSTRRPE